MKKTVFLFIFAFLGVLLITSLPQNSFSSGQELCCQQFRLVDGNGQPVTNCTLTVTGIGSVSPGLDGRCTICGFTAGNSYKAFTSCTTPIYGDVKFTACNSVEITITVQ